MPKFDIFVMGGTEPVSIEHEAASLEQLYREASEAGYLLARAPTDDEAFFRQVLVPADKIVLIVDMDT